MSNSNNPATNTQFQLQLDKFKDTLYMAQNVQFPSVTMPPVEIFPQEADLTLPANRVLYEPLVVSFLIDENFENYTQLYQWMLDLIAIDAGHLEEFTTGVIIMYDRQYQPIKRVTFKDMFCSGLSGFTLTTVDDDSILIADATFDFSAFKIENI